ncbi:MAG: hypothetical protein Q4G21_04470 [Dermabacter sp.]|nr:hypothetical protein [Dermabacter sp.]
MSIVMVALYLVSGALVALALVYVVRSLAADLLLMGGAAALSATWLLAALALLVKAAVSGGPTEAVTFWGYLLTGIALPIAGIYLSFIERTRWGSLAIGLIAATSLVLAYRLPQIWAGGFA